MTARAGARDGVRRDGLTDVDELADANGDGVVDVDLPAMGADPYRRDLFVELDWMVDSLGAGLPPTATSPGCRRWSMPGTSWTRRRSAGRCRRTASPAARESMMMRVFCRSTYLKTDERVHFSIRSTRFGNRIENIATAWVALQGFRFEF